MNHASLFTGIGGFDLAAEWMGWNNVFQVEIDPFCNKVLEKNFPNAKRYGDIKQFDGKPYRGTIDVLSGGFPCQPYSGAGKRMGTEDDRHLWPEMLRIIDEIQPTDIVGENVYGLVNWNEGLVFEQIQTDLENQGYEVASVILPACSANAWHRRDRIWFVAHFNGNGRQNEIIRETERCEGKARSTPDSLLTNLDSIGRKGRDEAMQAPQKNRYDKAYSTPGELRRNWERDDLPSPTICGVDDGIPNQLDRIKAIGNAIVPQVAYEIFKALEQTMIQEK